jgi:hypothetical protein
MVVIIAAFVVVRKRGTKASAKSAFKGERLHKEIL